MSNMKNKIVKAWIVISAENGHIFDDCCGDDKPFYPCFKTKSDAVEYRDNTWKEFKKVAKVISVNLIRTNL